MKFLLIIILSWLSTMASANGGITPLLVGQSTLETIKSLIRKEKINADKIKVLNINTEYKDTSSDEEKIEIKMSFVSNSGSAREARFLCHDVAHATLEAAVPHCHREE